MSTSIRRATALAIAAVALLSTGPRAGAASATVQTIPYQSLSLRVPAGWPVYDLARERARCARLDVHAVYLGHQGPDANCPARPIGKTEGVHLEPLDATVAVEAAQATLVRRVGGQRVRLDPADGVTHAIVAAVDVAGVLATISFGRHPELADQILGTLAVTPSPRPRPAPRGSPTPRPTPTPTPSPPALEPSGPFIGFGFDTCAAPSTASTQAWLASPYRAIGIYIGGANRACEDGNLSPSWVSAVQAQGWSLIPTYVGLQAPCAGSFSTIDPAQAEAQGAQAADDAAARAGGFALGPRTTIFFDMEAYDPIGGDCSSAVTAFLGAWTAEIHRQGHLSGVYGSISSVVPDLLAAPDRRPDAIWFANWDGVATTSDPAIPDDVWADHQRIKQFLGTREESYGGVTIEIDSSALDVVLRQGPAPPTPRPAPRPRS